MKPQVPKRIRKARYDRLMKLQASISLALNHEQVGKDIRVLIEEQIDDRKYTARSTADAPDVDGSVIVTAREDLRIGDFASVRVTGADVYDLQAEA